MSHICFGWRMIADDWFPLQVDKSAWFQNHAAWLITWSFDYINCCGMGLVKSLNLYIICDRRDYFFTILMLKAIHVIAQYTFLITLSWILMLMAVTPGPNSRNDLIGIASDLILWAWSVDHIAQTPIMISSYDRENMKPSNLVPIEWYIYIYHWLGGLEIKLRNHTVLFIEQ